MENKEEQLEEMTNFFTARVDEYENHMLNNVEGCKEGYKKMATLIPSNATKILDLGCGTGLELDEIFKLHPEISVTGVDLTQAMLDKLKAKHFDKKLDLRCNDYFKEDFGQNIYDCAISFETMHHFTHEKKILLYTKIYNSLKENACYIEADYMAESQDEENFLFAENERLRKENNVKEGEFFHFDTPCTKENQKMLLLKAGFKEVKEVFFLGGVTMLLAQK